MIPTHGKYHIELRGNTIYKSLKGSFNEDAILEIISKEKDIIKNLNSEKFSILIDVLEMEGATPEAFSVIDNYNKWLNTQNLLAQVFVNKSSFLIEINEERVKSQDKTKTKIFDNLEDAQKWLDTLKYN